MKSIVAIACRGGWVYNSAMYTLLVAIHVCAMITSMLLMSGAIGLGIFGKQLAVKIASVGMGATIVGFASGLLLMIASPLTLKCAILTSYLVVVTAVYWYGYGFGRLSQAHFVRGRLASRS